MQETRVGSPGQEGPSEKGVAAHSHVPAWRVLWTEELGGLQSMWSQPAGMTEATQHACRRQGSGCLSWAFCQLLTRLTVASFPSRAWVLSKLTGGQESSDPHSCRTDAWSSWRLPAVPVCLLTAWKVLPRGQDKTAWCFQSLAAGPHPG